eukprot:scaffold208132_cov29-Tisochrysis_lutea.AAC.2
MSNVPRKLTQAKRELQCPDGSRKPLLTSSTILGGMGFRPARSQALLGGKGKSRRPRSGRHQLAEGGLHIEHWRCCMAWEGYQGHAQ